MNGRLYDLVVARSPALERIRANLLRQAEGRVLEIGAGTGLNARHYPAHVDVTYVEPDPGMARRVPVVQARAEELPFGDASFDTVVSTLVLCSVDDLDVAIAEIARVLRPGGKLLFLEHVRGEGRRGRWQDRVNPVWRRLAGGCNCNRDTVGALARHGFSTVGSVHDVRLMPPHLEPLVSGVG